VTLSTLHDNKYTYNSPQKFKFARNCNYVFIALPTIPRPHDTNNKNTDTLLYLQTTILKPDDTNMAMIKFINANSDSAATYSIKLGCPNGENFFIDNQIASVRKYQNTGYQQIYEGLRVVSIIKNRPNQVPPSDDDDDPVETPSTISEVIGIFELQLRRLNQYVLVVNKYDDVYFIDELDKNSNLEKLYPVPNQVSELRIINLSSDLVSIESRIIGSLTEDLYPNKIQQYINIDVCQGVTLDELYLLSNDQRNDMAYFSFDIYKKYTILAFDDEIKASSIIVPIPPVEDRMVTRSDKAIVRVVNGNYNESGITVSIGARTYAGNKFESGVTLAVGLDYKEYSKEMYINGGSNVPITVFSTTQPTKYLFSGIVNLQNGKEYLITIDKLYNGKIAAIELNDQQQDVVFAPKASFVQIANATNGSMALSLGNIINNSTIFNSPTIATFFPEGNGTLTMGGKSLNFSSDPTIRSLFIAANTNSNPDIFAIQNPTMGTSNSTLRYRFINAATDVPTLVIKNSSDSSIVFSGIPYKTASDIKSDVKDRKFSFIFTDQGSNSDLLKTNDILMTLAKNYSIIFHGNKSRGYGIMILQEY
jgi:hypothetical protein